MKIFGRRPSGMNAGGAKIRLNPAQLCFGVPVKGYCNKASDFSVCVLIPLRIQGPLPNVSCETKFVQQSLSGINLS
jgi:hypothetical protein